MAPKNFKIIIAGGSVTGLTLALMLEAVGVDYILLEAHSELAPQVGASIALLPNGFRILDQLGLYEEIRGWYGGICEITGFRRASDGGTIASMYGMLEHTVRRLGYPMEFMDRQMLLQVLARNIKKRSQVLVGKRVTEVIPSANSIKVKTQDGDTFTGDILVGADGIHSVVRKEMWRIAREAKSNCFPPKPQSDLKCSCKCLFGISKCDNIVKFFFYYTGPGYSLIYASGPGGRVYWFLMADLDDTKFGEDIPRYTKEDEARLVEEHANVRIDESMTFAELYAMRIESVLVPLEENIFKRWHFGRIITLGDSAHKVHPITGQGGNSAIETAAVFVNHLMDKLKKSRSSLAEADIEDMFSKIHAIRSPRTKTLLKRAATLQGIAAKHSFITTLLFPTVLRMGSTHSNVEQFTHSFYDAAKLDMIKVPKQPRGIPFTDELPAKPILGVRFPKFVAMGLLAVIAYLSLEAIRLVPVDIPTFAGNRMLLKTTYTSLPPLDEVLSIMVSAFSYLLAGDDPAAAMQLFYFLPTLTPVFIIWTIESYRLGLRWSFISFPSIFGIAFQIFTIGRVCPIYFLLSIFLVKNKISARRVPLEVAKAILPAIILGYLVPTVLMVWPVANTFTRSNFIALWQGAPIYCAALTSILSKQAYQKVHYTSPLKLENKRPKGKLSAVERAMPTRTQEYEDSYSAFAKDDVPHLKLAYLVAFVTCTIMHIGTIAYLALGLDPELSLYSVFLNLPGLFSEWDISDFPLAWSLLFKFDMWFYFAALFVYLLYTVWDVRKLGYVTNAQATKAWLGIVVGQVLVGPGAVYAGVWWWKEDVLAGLGD